MKEILMSSLLHKQAQNDISIFGKKRYRITRRAFLKSTAVSLCATSLLPMSGCTTSRDGVIARFGLVTDIHYADTEKRGTRFYRQSARKLKECIDLMNAEDVDFIVELGDFKDNDKTANDKQALQNLQAIEKEFQRFKGPTYHVLGNHDLESCSKQQFFAQIDNSHGPSSRGYYSFNSGRVHFIVLDANFTSDGSDYDHGNFKWQDANIPSKELLWLQQDLAATERPVIVFIHQLLDGKGDVFVNNAEQVRTIFQNSEKVLAVFQGHHHPGRYLNIDNIHYHTLQAVVEGSGPENNSYDIVEIVEDQSIVVTGFRNAASRKFEQI